jgi:type IV pilus assembly protein PilE
MRVIHKSSALRVPKAIAGFTLIELMIVVAIIGILASIALPAYRDSYIKSRRADVQSQLVSHAQALERYFTTSGRYVTAAGGATCGVTTATALPATSHYTFGVVCADNTFTITATPVTTSSQKNDGTQTLDNTGAKDGTVGNGNWRK